MHHKFLTVLSLVLLTSCVQVFPPVKKGDTLLLTANIDPKLVAETALAKQIVITEPSMNAYLDKKGVMVEDQSGTVHYLAGIEWPSSLPNLLQEILVDGFITSKSFQGVSDSSLTVSPDYLLQLDFNKFHLVKKSQQVYDIVVLTTAQLIDFKTRKVLASQTFENQSPLKGFKTHAVRGAFAEQANWLLTEVIQWSRAKLA